MLTVQLLIAGTVKGRVQGVRFQNQPNLSSRAALSCLLARLLAVVWFYIYCLVAFLVFGLFVAECHDAQATCFSQAPTQDHTINAS